MGVVLRTLIQRVCHFYTFCFGYSFCFGSVSRLLTQKSRLPDVENRGQRLGRPQQPKSKRGDGDPARRASGGARGSVSPLFLSPRHPAHRQRSRSQAELEETKKTCTAPHCRGDGARHLTSARLTTVKTKPNRNQCSSEEHHKIQSLYNYQ